MHVRAFHAATSPIALTRSIGVVLIVLAFLWPSAALAQSLAWTQRAVNGPSPRYDHAMAYDSARGVVVLFGGRASTIDRNAETWEWDGITWTQRLVTGPSPRYGHAMAYDSRRGVTVLFGGFTGQFAGETWEWDGVTWTQRTEGGPEGSPRNGWYHAMSFDPVRQVTILQGGNVTVYPSERWEWNGTIWRRVCCQSPLTGPGGERSLTYDMARNVHVSLTTGTTWELVGSIWNLRSDAGPRPPGNDGFAMTYDIVRSATVQFGGSNNTTGLNAETWTWNGSVWTNAAISGPSARHMHAMVYHAGRNTTVLFGGYTTGPNGETWELATADAACPADLDNDGDFANGLTRDGAVTIEDLLSFLVGFEAGNILVDLDNGTSTGTPDNAVDINDLLFFLERFEAGC